METPETIYPFVGELAEQMQGIISGSVILMVGAGLILLMIFATSRVMHGGPLIVKEVKPKEPVRESAGLLTDDEVVALARRKAEKEFQALKRQEQEEMLARQTELHLQALVETADTTGVKKWDAEFSAIPAIPDKPITPSARKNARKKGYFLGRIDKSQNKT